jgi:hypothetical protein
MPGGRGEKEESPKATCGRESTEELGTAAKVLDLVKGHLPSVPGRDQRIARIV